ncbi:hypothetical protein L9F63_001729, partial [Diploptera punctata]
KMVSNMDNNNLSQNNPPSEVNFQTQKENEAAVALIQTDILCRQEQGIALKECSWVNGRN